MNAQDRKNLVNNIVSSMRGISGEKKDEIIQRQVGYFFRVDNELGMAVAEGMGITIDEKIIGLIL